MKTLFFITAISTFFFSAGCSTTTYLSLTENNKEQIEQNLKYDEQDENVGAEVTLSLKDRTEIKGELLYVQDSTLTICTEHSATENELAKNSLLEIAETKPQHNFNGGQERNVFLKKGFSAVPGENTTNQGSEDEDKTLILDYKKLKVGMPILIREFGKFGEWIRVQITNLTENIVHYKKNEYSSGSFPWGFCDVALKKIPGLFFLGEN